MSVLRRACALVLLLGLMALAGLCALPLGRTRALPLPPRWAGREPVMAAGEGPLRAGAAESVLALPAHPPLAGFPGLRRARAQAAPLRARAIFLQAGPAALLLASVDALLLPDAVVGEALKRAGLPAGTCALVAATHTHSGAGGLSSSWIAAVAGEGAPDPAVREATVVALAQALRGAREAAAPAAISWAREAWMAGPAEARDGPGPIDPTLIALQLTRPGGAVVATLAIYAMHGTAHPRKDRTLSPDWIGAAAQALAARGGVGLLLQGAEGDATWRREQGPSPEARLGAQVAREAQALLDRAGPPAARLELSCATQLVALPPPQMSPALPWPIRRAAANLASWAGEPFAVQTRAALVRPAAPALHLLGIPGEPVGELALSLRARDPSAQPVGLADGYVGYVETPERWQQGRGEAARTQLGPTLAEVLGLR